MIYIGQILLAALDFLMVQKMVFVVRQPSGHWLWKEKPMECWLVKQLRKMGKPSSQEMKKFIPIAFMTIFAFILIYFSIKIVVLVVMFC